MSDHDSDAGEKPELDLSNVGAAAIATELILE